MCHLLCQVCVYRYYLTWSPPLLGSVEGLNLCLVVVVVVVEVTMITVFMGMVEDMILEEVMVMEEDKKME